MIKKLRNQKLCEKKIKNFKIRLFSNVKLRALLVEVCNTTEYNPQKIFIFITLYYPPIDWTSQKMSKKSKPNMCFENMTFCLTGAMSMGTRKVFTRKKCKKSSNLSPHIIMSTCKF